jgi:hypothetical protein
MAKPAAKASITIECQIAPNIGYINYQSNLPLFRRFYIRNTSEIPVRDVEITITSDFTLPLTIKQELLPAKTTVNFNPEINFSPSFFVTISESASADISIEVKADGRTIGTSNLSVVLRGYGEFFGTSAQTELLAAYVSDKSPISTKILKAAAGVIENWKMKFKLDGGY